MKDLAHFVESRNRAKRTLDHNVQILEHLKEIGADHKTIKAQLDIVSQMSREYAILRAAVRIMIQMYKDGFVNNISVLYPVRKEIPEDDFNRYLCY